MTLFGAGAAQAQVDLTTYADAKGNLDIQKLTCAQPPTPSRKTPTS